MEYIEKVVLVKEKANDELIETREALEELDYYNDKVSFLISEWISDYSFNEKPDPQAALQWARENIDNRHCQQSAKWFWEYNRIHELIEIGLDYSRISRDMINDLRGAKENE